jgi:hypothetical protein
MEPTTKTFVGTVLASAITGVLGFLGATEAAKIGLLKPSEVQVEKYPKYIAMLERSESLSARLEQMESTHGKSLKEVSTLEAEKAKLIVQLNSTPSQRDVETRSHRLAEENRDLRTRLERLPVLEAENAKLKGQSHPTQDQVDLARRIDRLQLENRELQVKMDQMSVLGPKPKMPDLKNRLPQSATDISSSPLEVSAFLDINGTKERSELFSINGKCRVDIASPAGTGFTVAMEVLSDRGTTIYRSFSGWNPKKVSLDLTTGVYGFRLYSRRDAGSYSALLQAYCQ